MKFHEDDRAQRLIDIFPDTVKQVNVSYVPPTGSVIFGHWHKKQTDYWCVIKGGPLKVITAEIYGGTDNEPFSRPPKTTYLSDKNIKVFEIKPKIIHGYKNCSNTEIILLYGLTEQYDESDHYYVPWYYSGMDIWKTKNK